MASNNYERYFWTSFWLVLGTLLGISFVLWFSISNNLSSGLLLLWSVAYLVLGGLLGFIFSVPKIISENNTVTTTTTTTTNGTVTAGTIPAVGPASIKARFQENTNLTQISDWLTKILIGAGLVQLKDIPKFVLHVAKVMGKGVQSSGTGTEPTQTAIGVSAGIVLFFITWGFICGYLVMKLVLTEQFQNVDNGAEPHE